MEPLKNNSWREEWRDEGDLEITSYVQNILIKVGRDIDTTELFSFLLWIFKPFLSFST